VNFTPPLRGSRRGRAVYAKADSVGGESRFIATPSYAPHRIAFGLTPLALRLPLKGGVVVEGSTRGEWFGAIRKGFFNNPIIVGHLLIEKPEPQGGVVFPLVGRSVPSFIRILSITPLRAGRFFSHTYGPKKKVNRETDGRVAMPEIVRCRDCGKETYDTMATCPHCGEPLVPGGETDWKPRLEEAQKTGDWSKVPNHLIAQCAADITLTTGYFIANQEMECELEIVTAECVFGMNIFRDFFAGVTDIFGGRSGATQNVLRDARRTVLTELRREALIVGADAVIGVDLDYSEFSGKMKSMLFLVASGTAVKLKPQA